MAEQAVGSQGHPPSHPGFGGARGCSRLRLERFLLSLASLQSIQACPLREDSQPWG